MDDVRADDPPAVLDAQVHVYARDQVRQPWRSGGEVDGRPEVTGDDMAEAMDATGVGRAVLVSYFNPYGYDASYAVRVADERPDRFRVVAPVDVARSDVGSVVEGFGGEPHVVGLRLLMFAETVARGAADGAFDEFFRAARRADLPVSLMTWDTAALGPVAARYPDNVLVVDHLGVRQPHGPTEPRPDPSAFDPLLDLASRDNVYLKVSGVPTVSREPYPFPDLWPILEGVLIRFGVERCMWGSDWTRVLPMVSYEHSLGFVRDTDQLTGTEKRQLCAGTAEQVYRWPGSARF